MTIKFLTLNMWMGKRLEAALNFLEREDADVLLLQEVYDGTDPALPAGFRALECLRQRFASAYYEFAPILIDLTPHGKIPMGNAIFSKFPIISSDVTFFQGVLQELDLQDPKTWPHVPHNFLHAVLNTPVGPVHAYNIHGVWDLDGDNYSADRRRMSQAVLQAVKGKRRVLLGGDTNAKMSNQAIRDIETELTNVFGTELKSTYNMRHKTNPGYATAAVDALFVSKDVEVRSKACPQVDVSDHLPIVASVGMK